MSKNQNLSVVDFQQLLVLVFNSTGFSLPIFALIGGLFIN